MEYIYGILTGIIIYKLYIIYFPREELYGIENDEYNIIINNLGKKIW